MSSKLDIIVDNALKLVTLQRVIAFVLDLVVCFTISLCPRIGLALSVFYFLFRDILPFDGARSFGKSVYRLKLVPVDEETKSVMWRQAFVRNIVSLIPLVNLYDIYLFLLTGERLADQWSDTRVVILAEDADKKSSTTPVASQRRHVNNAADISYSNEDDGENEYEVSERVDSEVFSSNDNGRYDIDYVDTRSTND